MKSTNTSEPIPAWLPANAQDWFNYSARYTASNHLLHAVLELAGHLDHERLTQAVKLSADAEPILGCRFIEDPHHPYWQRIENIEESKWCVLLETDRVEESVQQFVGVPFDADSDPQVSAGVIRSKEKDTLCIKLNHAACDGAGVKQYLRLLAAIYTKLGMDSGYVPSRNVRGKRDQSALFMELGIVDWSTLLNTGVAELQPGWAFPFRRLDLPAGESTHLISQIKGEQVEALRIAAKRKGCTLNDLILTAYFRALWILVRSDQGEATAIQVTVDLRRHLTSLHDQAICNLSGAVNVLIQDKMGEPFEQTLVRIVVIMQEHKKSMLGIQSAAAFELLASMGYEEALHWLHEARSRAVSWGKAFPMLSNFGIIGDPGFMFGDSAVRAAYMISPALFAPGFMLGASTYSSMLTLCVNFYASNTSADDIQLLLSRMTDELNGYAAGGTR
ncbi:condensation domain-containing protein [Paenibacillus sp. MER TA 81-3]|uniref:condensation domain-containing protein n=1 Tax=Paenibacillus sp. MER TA 81-3 TaxID=2939573 RepID=UPI00203FD642|nr:condensation domain-containing protein [Paenibacillus sp. MER TA 81-3]MCM3339845.1 condensation domain-containing protein [Paenibacillus sp. MER TA 81-3]